MRIITRASALTATAMFALAACGGGGSGDREGLIESRLSAGNTQEQAECYADAVLAEFGEDPGADGQLEDGETDILLSLAFDCVGGAEG